MEVRGPSHKQDQGWASRDPSRRETICGASMWGWGQVLMQHRKAAYIGSWATGRVGWGSQLGLIRAIKVY